MSASPTSRILISYWSSIWTVSVGFFLNFPLTLLVAEIWKSLLEVDWFLPRWDWYIPASRVGFWSNQQHQSGSKIPGSLLLVEHFSFIHFIPCFLLPKITQQHWRLSKMQVLTSTKKRFHPSTFQSPYNDFFGKAACTGLVVAFYKRSRWQTFYKRLRDTFFCKSVKKCLTFVQCSPHPSNAEPEHRVNSPVHHIYFSGPCVGNMSSANTEMGIPPKWAK